MTDIVVALLFAFGYWIRSLPDIIWLHSLNVGRTEPHVMPSDLEDGGFMTTAYYSIRRPLSPREAERLKDCIRRRLV